MDIDSEALPVTAATCTEGITADDPETGHCYMLFTDEGNWMQARQRCAALGDGAHLADVTRDSEHPIIADLRADAGSTVWLAGNDQDVEGAWVWDPTGDPITTDFWEEGEPDSRSGEEDCLAILDPGAWHDRVCNLQFPYICERDAVPDEGDPPDEFDLDDDVPGSLYACAVAAPGGPGGPGLGWLLLGLALVFVARRR